jgi:hypothetical protein
MRVGGQLHAPATLPPGKRPGTHCIEGWEGPRASLDGCGRVDRWTDMTKLKVLFSTVNAPKNDVTFILPRLLYSVTSDMIIFKHFRK